MWVFLCVCFVIKKQHELMCSKRTMLCSLNAYLFSTTRYIKIIKEEKRPQAKSSKGSEDS